MIVKNEINKKQRIEYIDALKGIAIFFVLWGHSLQYLKNGYDFFHNPMFEFIYSFHMPLFFILSGFFFRSSQKRNLKEFLLKKSIQLLLPCIVWSVIFILMWVSINLIKGNSHVYSDLPKRILSGAWDIWFLRELFISYFIVFVSLKILKKAWLACILSILFVLISPYFCEVQRVFLPIFWVGLFLKDNYHIISRFAKHILIISGIVFTICLLFWDGNYTMYVTSFPSIIKIKTLSFDFTYINISIFRLFIGFCGSIFFFSLFEIVYVDNKLFNWLTKIGANTLAIYLLQRLILENWANRLIDFPAMNLWLYNLVITPLVSFLILIVCFILIKSVQKMKYAEFLLWGKK